MAELNEIIADEWAERASELADWAMAMLVNRKDVWGQYSVLTPAERRRHGKSYKAMTLPVKDQRGGDKVTLDKLTRHFASRPLRKPQIIGLHAQSEAGTSRWFGIDIDLHDPDETTAEDHARRNLNAALFWWQRLLEQGYDPLLFDSNGFGGYHLWVLFEQPAPTTDVFAMAHAIVSEWQDRSLDREPETFPKKYKPGKLGAWFRLPGLHHSKPYHSRLWSGDEWLDDPWLTGHSAIDVMLQVRGGPPPPVVDTGQQRSGEMHPVNPRTDRPAVRREQRFERTGKATVCVDLDGVLAQRVEGGLDTIGPPIDGARDFLKSLEPEADILIYTARLSGKSGRAQQRIKEQIEQWLQQHAMPYHDIHTEPGKPLAHAFVDDRGVGCRPEVDGVGAFDRARGVLAELL